MPAHLEDTGFGGKGGIEGALKTIDMEKIMSCRGTANFWPDIFVTTYLLNQDIFEFAQGFCSYLEFIHTGYHLLRIG